KPGRAVAQRGKSGYATKVPGLLLLAARMESAMLSFHGVICIYLPPTNGHADHTAVLAPRCTRGESADQGGAGHLGRYHNGRGNSESPGDCAGNGCVVFGPQKTAAESECAVFGVGRLESGGRLGRISRARIYFPHEGARYHCVDDRSCIRCAV